MGLSPCHTDSILELLGEKFLNTILTPWLNDLKPESAFQSDFLMEILVIPPEKYISMTHPT